MIKNDINSDLNLIDDAKLQTDSLLIENEMKHFKEEHEGENILNDIRSLEEMGYEKTMINKIYILLRPENIDRAIDYMAEIDGIYQHNFFESNNKSKDKGLCFICKKSKKYHLDYIPEELINEFNHNSKKLMGKKRYKKLKIEDFVKKSGDSKKEKNYKEIINNENEGINQSIENLKNKAHNKEEKNENEKILNNEQKASS